ncbi:IclR family transcriptional regulator [Polaromonas sp. YR568]|uniref:IclR family transcriptional regulator n=1 Tax=Polaromonas sp. YR568 TaxID=1855301 RepID=UPI003138366F
MNIIELLAVGARSMALGEIAETLGEPKSGIHRLLTTLVNLGWAEQDPHTGFYRLTMRLTLLGQRVYADTGIPDLCQPLLDELASKEQEYVRLAVVAGGSLNWLADAQGARGGLIYHPPQVSGTVPLHATASGKAWLSTLDEQAMLACVMAQGMAVASNPGPNLIKTIEDFTAAVRETAMRGYGTAISEAESGVCAVAAPIRLQSDGPAVGTLSIAGPSIRMTDERLKRLGSVVIEYAHKLGEIWPLRHHRGKLRAVA